MPDTLLKPALRAALRLHEIGNASPYQLFFAGKGKSGASFGFMQGDLAAGRPEVRQTFRKALAAASIAAEDIASIAKRLSLHLIVNPLGPGETKRVNDALLAGRTLVDAMDEALLAKVYASLDRCIATASGGRARDRAKGADLYGYVDQHDWASDQVAHLARRQRSGPAQATATAW